MHISPVTVFCSLDHTVSGGAICVDQCIGQDMTEWVCLRYNQTVRGPHRVDPLPQDSFLLTESISQQSLAHDKLGKLK